MHAGVFNDTKKLPDICATLTKKTWRYMGPAGKRQLSIDF